MPQTEKGMTKEQVIEQFYKEQMSSLVEEKKKLIEEKDNLKEKIGDLEKELNDLDDIKDSKEKLNSRIEGMAIIVMVLKRSSEMLLNDIESMEERNKLEELEQKVANASNLSVPMNIYSFIALFLSAILMQMIKIRMNFWEWINRKNENRISELKEEAKAHEELISNQQNTISASVAQISGLQQNILDKEQEVKQTRQEIEHLNGKISEWKASADNLSIQLREKKDSLASMQQMMEQKIAEINSMNAQISQLNDVVANLQAVITGQKALVSNLEEQLKEKETDIRTSKQEIARKIQEIQAQKESIAQLEASQAQTIQQLQNTLNEVRQKNFMINTLNDTIKKMQNENSSLKTQIGSLEEQAQKDQQTIEGLKVKNSRTRRVVWILVLLCLGLACGLFLL